MSSSGIRQTDSHCRRFFVFAKFDIIVINPENIQHLSDNFRVVWVVSVPLSAFTTSTGDWSFQQRYPPANLHEKPVDSMQSGLAVQPSQMVCIIGSIP